MSDSHAETSGVAVGRNITDAGIVTGNDNETHSARSNNEVHIALDRVADMSERELNQIAELVREIAQLRGEVSALIAEVAGNEKYKRAGLIHRIVLVENSQITNRLVLAMIAASELIQWLLLYWIWQAR